MVTRLTLLSRSSRILFRSNLTHPQRHISIFAEQRLIRNFCSISSGSNAKKNLDDSYVQLALSSSRTDHPTVLTLKQPKSRKQDQKRTEEESHQSKILGSIGRAARDILLIGAGVYLFENSMDPIFQDYTKGVKEGVFQRFREDVVFGHSTEDERDTELRTELLNRIDRTFNPKAKQCFEGSKKKVKIITLCGSSESGKTEAAKQYIDQFHARVTDLQEKVPYKYLQTIAYFPPYLSEEEFEEKYREFSASLLEEKQEVIKNTPIEEIKKRVDAELIWRKNWLLVFENIEDITNIQKYIPTHLSCNQAFYFAYESLLNRRLPILSRKQNGCILLTRTSKRISEEMIEPKTSTESIPTSQTNVPYNTVPSFPWEFLKLLRFPILLCQTIEPILEKSEISIDIPEHALLESQAIRIFDKIVGEDKSAEFSSLSKASLVRQLKFTPLAIKRAAALIKESNEKYPIEDYISKFRKLASLPNDYFPGKEELLDSKYQSIISQDAIVNASQKLSLEKVKYDNSEAFSLLLSFSLLENPENIPISIANRLREQLFPSMDQANFNHLIGKLEHYYLIENTSESKLKISSSFQKTLIEEFKENKNIAINYLKIGTAHYYLGNYRKALKYNKKGLNISLEINSKNIQGRAYVNIGIDYQYLGKHFKALEHLKKGLEIAQEVGDKSTETKAYRNLGIVYKTLQNYHKALKYQERSLEIAQEIDDKNAEGKAYGNIGNVYKNLKRYHKALEYYNKRLEIAREISDKNGKGKAYGNIGVAYKALGKYAKALKYFEDALEIFQEIGNKGGKAKTYSNIGNIYHLLGNYYKALEFHKKSLKTSTKICAKESESDAHYGIANAYLALKNYPKAKEYYGNSLNIGKKTGDQWIKEQAESGLEEIKKLEAEKKANAD